MLRGYLCAQSLIVDQKVVKMCLTLRNGQIFLGAIGLKTKLIFKRQVPANGENTVWRGNKRKDRGWEWEPVVSEGVMSQGPCIEHLFSLHLPFHGRHITPWSAFYACTCPVFIGLHWYFYGLMVCAAVLFLAFLRTIFFFVFGPLVWCLFGKSTGHTQILVLVLVQYTKTIPKHKIYTP